MTFSLRRLTIVGVLVGVNMIVGGCSQGSSAGVITTTRHFTWNACGQGLECARVSVPLDWSHRNGAQITLAVIRHIGSKPGKHIGSLFFNPGGPGVSGVDTVRGGGTDLDALGGGRFDVVSWDPRGTGASTHVRCFLDEADLASFWDHQGIPTTKASSPPYLRKTSAFARRCAHQSGLLLRHVSTADTARDLEFLRELLGDERLTYLGWSYGSFVGVTYLNMFPNRVRAMVLDGAVDPVVYVTGREAALNNGDLDSDLIFAKFESLCQQARSARCVLANHGSVAARIDRLLQHLKTAPIPAPSAPGGKLTYGDMLMALFFSLRSPADWPQIAKDINAAERGNGSSLEKLALNFRSPSGYELLIPSIAIGCADSPAQHGPQKWPQVIESLTHVSFIYGPLVGWWLWAPCASWPTVSADRYIGPWDRATKNPVLIIGNRFDPNTPFVNAVHLQRLLNNAILLTLDGYGHVSTSDPSTCIERAERKYLENLITPARETVCPADHVPFDPNFGKPPAGAIP